MASPDLERIRLLTDEGSFTELHPDIPCTYRTGSAFVEGRPVMLCATRMEPLADVDLMEGIRRYLEAQDEAARRRCPLVVLLDQPPPMRDGRGQWSREPDRLLADPTCCLGSVYQRHATLSGEVPQVGVLFGQVNAALSFPVAMCDVAILLDGSAMRIGPPRLVKTMIGEDADPATLGSAAVHCAVTGSGDVLVHTEAEALAWARAWLSCLPSHRTQSSPRVGSLPPPAAPEGGLASLMPEEPAWGCDMRRLLPYLVDGAKFLEMKGSLASEVLTGFARFDGVVAGVVASHSKSRGGALFPETCRKMVHFITLCDAWRIPLVFLADVPGFMVGTQNERSGAVRDAALLFSVLGNARVGRLLVVLRKAYTAGLYAMGGPGFVPRGYYAVPGATISTFGKPLLDMLATLDEFAPEERQGFLEMSQECGHPEVLVEKGLLDGVISLDGLRDALTDFVHREAAVGVGEDVLRRPVLRV